MKSATLTAAMVKEFSEKHGVTMGHAKRIRASRKSCPKPER